MSKIRDQHMHSKFSFDSKEEIERYIEVACGNKIVTTEHLEFGNPIVEYSDNIPEDSAYRKEINRLNQKYGQCVLTGIEIGYVARYEEKIPEFLKDKTYDLTLLSVHHDGEHDFIQEWAHTQPVELLIPHYYRRWKAMFLQMCWRILNTECDIFLLQHNSLLRKHIISLTRCLTW